MTKLLKTKKMQIKWTEQAQSDLLRIYEYYKPISPAVGKRLVKKIREKADYLKEFPRMARVGLLENTFEAVVLKTGYFIVYKLLPDEENPKIIYITSIYNGRQDR